MKRLNYFTQIGRFNWCSDEETLSCHIAVLDENNNKIISTNITPNNGVDGNDVNEAIEILQKTIKNTIYSTSEKERGEMIAYLKDNQTEIEEGNKEYRISQLKKNIYDLEKELKELL